MREIRNGKGKRVCDVSEDGRCVEIVRDGCVTKITVKTDGTLQFEHYFLTA